MNERVAVNSSLLKLSVLHLQLCYNPPCYLLLFYHILKPTCYYDFHLYNLETPKIMMNTNCEMFMILLCRNAAWGKISILLILQVSPQMTLRFLLKSKPKAMSVIGLYAIDSAIATIMVQLGNKLPGIGKQHTDGSGKINLFFRRPTA